MDPLPKAFYQRNTVLVACELIGKILNRRSREGLCCGRIVEVEAYLFENDPACHAARGQTRSNRAMFGPAGRAYVYPIHSRHCLNAVTEHRGVGAAVLIRAIEPTVGIELMQHRRRREHLIELARGPGRLCEALAIDRQLDHWNLTVARRLWISSAPTERVTMDQIRMSPRIGISAGAELPLRFFLADNRFVSGKRTGATKVRLPTTPPLPRGRSNDQ